MSLSETHATLECNKKERKERERKIAKWHAGDYSARERNKSLTICGILRSAIKPVRVNAWGSNKIWNSLMYRESATHSSSGCTSRFHVQVKLEDRNTGSELEIVVYKYSTRIFFACASIARRKLQHETPRQCKTFLTWLARSFLSVALQTFPGDFHTLMKGAISSTATSIWQARPRASFNLASKEQTIFWEYFADVIRSCCVRREEDVWFDWILARTWAGRFFSWSDKSMNLFLQRIDQTFVQSTETLFAHTRQEIWWKMNGNLCWNYQNFVIKLIRSLVK